MNELLREIGRRVAEQAAPAYFVGGCVRDLLRGEPIKDVDLAVSGDPHAVGKVLARAFEGHVFWLRQEEDVARVHLPQHGRLQLDFTRLRGSLEEDLLARDLTINAMAVPAEAGLEPGVEVLDPTGGQRDLAAKVVRFVRPDSPEQDPLRVMRALRFRWKLGFTLAEETRQRARECAPFLARVSSERIRDELFQLLALPQAADALAETLELGTARWLLGQEVKVPVENGEPAPCARVRRLQALLHRGPEELRGVMEAEVTPPRRRREVLLWAGALQTLLPEIDPAAAARHLALSNDVRQLIVKGLEGAELAADAARRWPMLGHERRRLFQRSGAAKPEAVLLAGARDGWTEAHGELLREALDRLLRPEPPLLTGLQVMERFGVKPGPRLGQLLDAVEDARADGLLLSAEEALEWLRARVEE